MFDITDPFGTAKIKSLEYEMKVKTCDMQGQIDYYRERALESSHVASYLAGLMESQFKDLQESRKAYKELGQMFAAGEEARKTLGEKHREVNNQLATLDRRFKELCENYDQLAERCAAKERELEELYAEHEALVRELRDGSSEDARSVPLPSGVTKAAHPLPPSSSVEAKQTLCLEKEGQRSEQAFLSPQGSERNGACDDAEVLSA